MYEGIMFDDGLTLNMNLTSRYRLRTNDFGSDQDFYQYLRGNLSGINLGNGTVSGSLFLRFADDIDGDDGHDWGDGYYYFYKDSLDQNLDGENWDTRFYHGKIVFDSVVENTKLTLGRQYVSHLKTVQLDGADLSYDINDKIKMYAFSGGAVSYFDTWDDDYLHGAGIEYKIFEKTKLRGEYLKAEVEGFSDDIITLRVDQNVDFGHIYGEYSNIEKAESFETGGTFRIAATNTTISLKYLGVYDKIGDDTSYIENPLAYVLLPYGKYDLYNVGVYQGLFEHIALGAGVEFRDVSGNEDFFNRAYSKYYGNIDFIDLPFSNTYISLFTEYWNVNSNSDVNNDENKLQFGAMVSQQITPTINVWTGTRYDRYKYDFGFYDRGDKGRKRESIRTYYMGGKWEPNTRFSFTLDMNVENSDVFDEEDFATNYTVEAWLNIIL